MPGIEERVLSKFTLRGCEKICSWFDMLTTSGVPQWKFKCLAARPEPVEGQRLIFLQPLSMAEGLEMTMLFLCDLCAFFDFARTGFAASYSDFWLRLCRASSLRE
jgi:hypothetical protein